MQLVHKAHRSNSCSSLYRLQQNHALCPVTEHHHHRAVHMFGRGENSGQAK